MALYLPTTNPLRFVAPATLEALSQQPYAEQPQYVPEGSPMVVQVRNANPDGQTLDYRVAAYALLPDGSRELIRSRVPITWNSGVYDGDVLTMQLTQGEMPRHPSYRLLLVIDREYVLAGQLGPAGSARCAELVSNLITTTLRGPYVVLKYNNASAGAATLGAYWSHVYYRPTLYVPGGFFTGGFSPEIEADDYRVGAITEYLNVRPRVSRTLTLGGPQGIDNGLAETINAALCCATFAVDGVAYTRFDGAKLEPLGDAKLPRRAWQVALQAVGGDLGVKWKAEAAGSEGTLLDARDRYVTDSNDRYLTEN